jgi:hypothetical protein
VTVPVLVVVMMTRAKRGANKKFDCCVVVAPTTDVSDVFTQFMADADTGANGSFGSSNEL